MSKHTPGPWDWDAGNLGIEVPVPYCEVVAQNGELTIAHVNDIFNKTEGRANARLIAAAPEVAV